MNVAPLSFTDSPLIALDIDGTILHHDGYLAERVVSSIRAVVAANAHVMIATGRSIRDTLPIIEAVGLSRDGAYAVCCNGAITIQLDSSAPDGYRLHRVTTFDARPSVEILQRELPDLLIAVETPNDGVKVNEHFPEPEFAASQRVVSPQELLEGEAVRVTVRDLGSEPEDFAQVIAAAGLHGTNYSIGFSAWLDLAPEGVSKAYGLEEVRQLLGVDPLNTVAIGDQRNDLEMLAWAELGVAMGQAPQEVIAAANRTTGAVVDDGLADILDELLPLIPDAGQGGAS